MVHKRSSNGLSKWTYTEFSVNWRSKSADHCFQWAFVSASFLDIYGKLYNQYTNAGNKKSIKKHCFNKVEIEDNWTHISPRVQGYLNFGENRLFVPNTVTARKLDALEVTLAGSGDNFTRRQRNCKRHQFCYIKKQIAGIWWPKANALYSCSSWGFEGFHDFLLSSMSYCPHRDFPLHPQVPKFISAAFCTKSRFMRLALSFCERGLVHKPAYLSPR